MSFETLRFIEEIDYKSIVDSLKKKWDDKHSQSGVFNYKLNIENERILDGNYRYFLQLNRDRTNKRRSPQFIKSVVTPFNPNEFNFTKVNENEILLEIDSEKFSKVTLLINNSPLTQYHTLICPSVDKCLPQKLDFTGLAFCLEMLMCLNDSAYRIGYNSPLALASVNHFHLHLLYLPSVVLYVETMKLIPSLETHGFYKTSDDTIKGFCFRIMDTTQIATKCKDACKLVNYLCNQGLAHNVFITHEKSTNEMNDDDGKCLRLFIWPREKPRILKNLAPFNVGFCEIAGYVTVGCETLFESLTEEIIHENITAELGNGITEKIEQDLIKILNDS